MLKLTSSIKDDTSSFMPPKSGMPLSDIHKTCKNQKDVYNHARISKKIAFMMHKKTQVAESSTQILAWRRAR